MKKKIYIGEQSGEKALKQAWLDVFQESISEPQLKEYLDKPIGTVMVVREAAQAEGTDSAVYWVAVGNSKSICKEAWADFWPLVDDSILNWEIIEVEEDTE